MKKLHRKDWEEVAIGDVFDRVSKPVTVDPTGQYHEIGIRSHGKGIFEKPPILGALLGEKRVYSIEPDCLILNIVFAWEQAVAKTTQNELGKIASHRFPMYRPKFGKIDVDFALYFFKSKWGKNLLELSSPGGAGRNKTLSQSGFFELQLCLPPINQQRRIVRLLGVWDRAIEQMERLIAAKRRQFDALLKVTFSSARDLAVELPTGWHRKPIGSLAKVVGGGTPDTGNPSLWNGNVLWCTPTDLALSRTRHLTKTARTISDRGLSSSSATMLPCGSIILCSRASVGVCAIADVPMSTNQGFQNLVPKTRTDSQFLYYLVGACKRRIIQNAAGSTFLEISGRELSKLVVAAPTVTEQRRIGRQFAALDDEIDLLAERLEALRNQKRGLMQKLLTGEWQLDERFDPAPVMVATLAGGA